MVPDVRDIVRWRHLLAGVLRLIGLLMFLFSFAPMLSWLVEGVMDGDLFWFNYYAARIFLAVGMLLVGVVLIVFARPLTRWVVPWPIRACPRCHYALDGLTRPVCPECGLHLPAEFLPPASPAATLSRPPSAPSDVSQP